MRWTLFEKLNLNFSPKLISNPNRFENALFSDLIRYTVHHLLTQKVLVLSIILSNTRHVIVWRTSFWNGRWREHSPILTFNHANYTLLKPNHSFLSIFYISLNRLCLSQYAVKHTTDHLTSPTFLHRLAESSCGSRWTRAWVARSRAGVLGTVWEPRAVR